MQSLELIRKRLETVKLIAKITNAMQLIATAKIKKQKKDYLLIADYCTDFYNIIDNLITTDSIANFSTRSALLGTKPSASKKPTLWVAITSSLGLCGSFNNNIIKELVKKIQPEDKIMVVGLKGLNLLKAKGYQQNIHSFYYVSDKKPSYYELLPLCETLLEEYAKENFKNVKLIYTNFKNALNFEPRIIQLVPFVYNNFIERKIINVGLRITSPIIINTRQQQLEYESEPLEILEAMIPIYINTLMHAALLESLLCESSSRRNAMDTATENAKSLVDELNTKYNKARQEKITQEINEIITGAENE